MPAASSTFSLDRINNLLDAADENEIAVTFGDSGRPRMSANRRTPQYVNLKTLLNQAYKQNPIAVRHAIQQRLNPPAMTPGDYAREGLDFAKEFLPSTPAGLGAAAALVGGSALTGGADLPLLALLGLGAGGGALGSTLDTFTKGSAAPQRAADIAGGAAVGGLNALGQYGIGKAFKLAKFIPKWYARPRKLDFDMMAGVGKQVQENLKDFAPKTASRIIADRGEFGVPGKDTVVRVLNSKAAQEELGKGIEDAQSTVIGEVAKKAQADLDTAAEQFEHQYGWNPVTASRRPENLGKVEKAEIQAASQFPKLQARARNIAGDLKNAFSEISGQSRAIHDTSGALQHSYKAWKLGTQTIPELQQTIENEIKSADVDGSLSNLLETARDNYSKFSGYKKLVNTDHVLTPDGKWFEAEVLQKAMDPQTNPAVKFIQGQLKGAFQPLADTVRRGAAPFDEHGEPIISDIQSRLPKVHMGENVPLLGRIYSAVPGVPSVVKAATKFIGPEAKLPPSIPGRVPALLNLPLSSKEQQVLQPDE